MCLYFILSTSIYAREEEEEEAKENGQIDAWREENVSRNLSIYPSIFFLWRFCDINYFDDVTEEEIPSKRTDSFHTFFVNGIERITTATARIDSDRQPDGKLMHVGTRFACR